MKKAKYIIRVDGVDCLEYEKCPITCMRKFKIEIRKKAIGFIDLGYNYKLVYHCIPSALCDMFICDFTLHVY